MFAWHLADNRGTATIWSLTDKSGQLASELFSERRCRLRFGKIPPQMVLIVFAATASEARFDAAHGMKVMHGIEPIAEAALRHRNLNDLRELSRNIFGAWATFVAHQV